MAENTQADVKKLSFERAIEELESIVKRLEDGKVPLEESVDDLRARRGAEAPLRGIAAAGRGPRRQDHHRRQRPGDRDRAARRAMIRGHRRIPAVPGSARLQQPGPDSVYPRISSWRPARPDIVRPTSGDITCAFSTAISSIFRATIRAGWRNITACSGPNCASSAGCTSFRPPSAGPRSPPTTRSRPGPSRPRRTTGRPAPPTISSASRISSSRTWRRRSGAPCSARSGSIGGWCSPAPSPASARRTGALRPSSPIRI